MTGYLLDTSVVIDWLAGRPGVGQWMEARIKGGAPLVVTPITIAEVLAGVEPLRHAKVLSLLEGFLLELIDAEVAATAGRLCWEHDRSGTRVPLPDLLQAAVAIKHNLSVATSNTRHFPDVPHWDPRQPNTDPPSSA